MKRFLSALILLSLVHVPGVDAQTGDCTEAGDFVDGIDFREERQEGCLHLQTSAGDGFEIVVDSETMGSSQTSTVFAEMTCDCPLRSESIVRQLTAASGSGASTVWRLVLPVDTPDLVTGDWVVRLDGSAGSTGISGPYAYTLHVVADDVSDPLLRALNADAETGIVSVGKGQGVQVTVEDALIREVEYTLDGVGPLTWAPPYRLDAENFQPTGEHTLTVMAEDRAGHTAELSFRVYADVDDPIVQVHVPDRLYRNATNDIVVQAMDASQVTVRARIGDIVVSQGGEPGNHTYSLPFIPDTLGQRLVEITVEDQVGNRVRVVEAAEVVPLDVDLELVSVEQVDGGAIPGEDLKVRIEARQDAGIADIDATVTFIGQALGVLSIAAEGDAEQTLTFSLPPGVHTGNLTLVAPLGVNETDPADNQQTVTLERFLARVIHGDDVYHIRATPQGLPQEAVAANGTTYPLRLEDMGLRSVHAFDVEGTTLYWDPASTVTDIPVEEDDDGKDSPGLPALLVIAVLAGVALRRRS